MEFFVTVLVFAVIWAWVEILRSKREFRAQNSALVHRVWTLEQELAHASPVPKPAPQPQPQPHVEVKPVAAPPVVPPPIPVFETAAPPEPHVAPPPPPPPPTPPPFEAPAPPKRKPATDWEALIGGNVLNKVGALLLVKASRMKDDEPSK